MLQCFNILFQNKTDLKYRILSVTDVTEAVCAKVVEKTAFSAGWANDNKTMKFHQPFSSLHWLLGNLRQWASLSQGISDIEAVIKIQLWPSSLSLYPSLQIQRLCWRLHLMWESKHGSISLHGSHCIRYQLLMGCVYSKYI